MQGTKRIFIHDYILGHIVMGMRLSPTTQKFQFFPKEKNCFISYETYILNQNYVKSGKKNQPKDKSPRHIKIAWSGNSRRCGFEHRKWGESTTICGRGHYERLSYRYTFLFKSYLPAWLLPMHNKRWHHYRLKLQSMDSIKKAVTCNHVSEGFLPMVPTALRFYLPTFIRLRGW